MRIIPAIDIIDGKCVRLSQGDYNSKKIYNENPLEVAKEFEAYGIHYLHLVDLDGAKAGKVINHRVLEKIASGTGLKVDFGGGLKSDGDLKIAFELGAKQVTGGSIAVKDPETFLSWLKKFGSEKIILGADAKNKKVMVSGWEEDSGKDLLDFVKDHTQKGIKYVICTDVTKDGMLEGPSLDLYREILDQEYEIKLIASGGVTSMDDLYELQEIGCEGVIVGKAIYEGRIGLKELEKFELDNGG